MVIIKLQFIFSQMKLKKIQLQKKKLIKMIQLFILAQVFIKRMQFLLKMTQQFI